LLNRGEAIIKRGLAHLKQYGLIGSSKRYLLMKKWRGA
jgi:hypothetical protein